MVRKLLDALHRRRSDLFVVFWLNVIYFFSYFQRVAVPGTVFNEIQQDLGISSAAVTLMGAMYLYSYGVMQVFSGVTIDRFGAVRTAIVGGLILSVGSILFALSHTLGPMYATRVLVGIGSSLIYLCVVKQLDVRFRDKSFSMLLSASQSFGFAGGLFATFPFERSVDAMGWRESLLLIGLISTLVVLIAAFLNRGWLAVHSKKTTSPPFAAVRTVVRNRVCYPAIIGNAVVYTSYFVVQAIIGKKLLEDCCGLSSPSAASFTFAMMLTAMVSGVIGGFIPATMGHRRKPMLICACVGAALASGGMVIGLGRGAPAMWVLSCYILFGLMSAAISVFCSSVKELNPPENAATSVGVSNSVCWLSVALVSTACGIVMNAFRAQAVVTKSAIRYPAEAYQVIFIGLLAMSLCAVILSLAAKETKGENRWVASPVREQTRTDAL